MRCRRPITVEAGSYQLLMLDDPSTGAEDLVVRRRAVRLRTALQ